MSTELDTQDKRFVINSLGECHRGNDYVHFPDAIETEATRKLMTPEEANLSEKWCKLADILSDSGLFRVWAEMKVGEAGKVWLSTEFNYFPKKTPKVKGLVEKFATDFKCNTWVMHELPHSDRYSMDNCKTWIEGPDHGKMERQVCVDADVTDLDPADLPKLVKKMHKAAVKAGLDDYWVCVF